MSHGQDQISAAMQTALRLLEKARTVDAEEHLVQAARMAEQNHGVGSYPYAVASNDLGNLYSYLGDLKRAAIWFRKACAGPLPEETQPLRDRLTFLINLAGVLEALGELEEAEEIHRQSVAGRLEFYGADHPGLAFGLEPLGALLLRQGNSAEAFKLLDQCVRICWNSRHPRIATALALRAEAMKAEDIRADPFDGFEDLPENILTEMTNTVVQRAGQTDPILARHVQADVLALLRLRLGDDHPNTLNLLAAIANHEGELGSQGDHALRLEAIQISLASLQRQGRDAEVLQLLQGLALAQSAAGLANEARQTYQDVLDRALLTKDRSLISQIRRNFALFLADREQLEEAEDLLRGAIEDAEAVEDQERWGRAEGCLGILLMHQGRLGQATLMLNSALQHLEPSHPDAVSVRHHINALEAGESCQCTESQEAVLDQLRAYILKKLPEGLLEDLELRAGDDNLEVSVQLAREPSPEEIERLQILINQAVLSFKKQVGRRT